MAYARWAAAVLHNGLGRYTEAQTEAGQASEDTYALHISMWALPELIEAAARNGNTRLAASAAERLAAYTEAGGTDFGLGIQARSRALVSEPQAAEGLYREAIDRLDRPQLRPELARAYLLYGEWLRRENRRTARLARDGRTNPEIGAQLFISVRTVEWHLRKVFTKLGISSRRDLHTALQLLGQGSEPS